MAERQVTATRLADVSPVSASWWRRRSVSVSVYAVALAVWLLIVGPPMRGSDVIVVFCWLWLATIAWNIQLPAREHLGFLRDWWIPMVLLLVYMSSRGLADELGTPVHVTSAIRFDEWLFGGTMPTVTLQDKWCGEPCAWDSHGQWYDTLFAVVYYSHFVVGLTIAVVLWLRNRTNWMAFMRRYIGINFVGLVGYLVYPLAPPWWASENGYLGEPVTRITARGWDTLGLHSTRIDVAAAMPTGNPIAAMPSLHTATATLVAIYGISRLRHPARWLLLLYPATMGLALVYNGEHYVLDLLAGVLVAFLVVWAAGVWERRRARSAAAPDEPPESTRELAPAGGTPERV
jgi:membrane-associated phospholipid phosphatase